MRKLKYNFEYGCSPIWIEEIGVDDPIMENIDVDGINIDGFLKNEIRELNEIYQSTYNEKDGRKSGFISLYQYSIFVNRVIFSAQLLKKSLSKEYMIVFNLNYWNQLLSTINREFKNI